jgi:hypothetical protein
VSSTTELGTTEAGWHGESRSFFGPLSHEGTKEHKENFSAPPLCTLRLSFTHTGSSPPRHEGTKEHKENFSAPTLCTSANSAVTLHSHRKLSTKEHKENFSAPSLCTSANSAVTLHSHWKLSTKEHKKNPLRLLRASSVYSAVTLPPTQEPLQEGRAGHSTAANTRFTIPSTALFSIHLTTITRSWPGST